tara:strand:- start:779 stop:1330 length:552 start_codon:yes stop_codon:yes gene_type:complete
MKQPITADTAKSKEEWVYPYAKISRSRKGDPAILGPNLRKADADEVYAVAGISPKDGLQYSMEASTKCYTISDLETDEPLAMFGTGPSHVAKDTGEPVMGGIWFLGSDKMFEKNRISFLRNSKFWVQKLLRDYTILHNLVDARNVIHIRWLKWMGFTFIADVPEFGFEKRLFKQFYMRREDND